jgi:hypothetical protein
MNIFDKSLIPSCKILIALISTDQDETNHKILAVIMSSNQDEIYRKTFIPEKSSMLNLPTLRVTQRRRSDHVLPRNVINPLDKENR